MLERRAFMGRHFRDANIRNLKLPLLLPGMSMNTSPTDFFLIKQGQLGKFNGTQWQLFGELIGAAA